MRAPTMVTYGSPEMVDVGVSASDMTERTRAEPQDERRIVGRILDPIVGTAFEVLTGYRYKFSVGGEHVHTFEHYIGDTRDAYTVVELPDGSRYFATGDGRFAAHQGRAGTRVTLLDEAEWSRFGWHVEGDRVGWSIGSGVFDSRKVLQ
ncbi:hypothetical protein SEA_KEWPIEDOLL_7 [Gordonia phage Kewpiedoll]|nr:hypothetical protein SEA_KEWPIEDOLL_7 [Gordonia phage Kewpiedoll]